MFAELERRYMSNRESEPRCTDARSPMESDVLVKLADLANTGVDVRPQVEVCGYIVDFMLTDSHGSLAIELDGREFHDAPRDEARDEVIVSRGHVSAVERIPASGWFHLRAGSLHHVVRQHPRFFVPKALEVTLTIRNNALRDLEMAEYGYGYESNE